MDPSGCRGGVAANAEADIRDLSPLAIQRSTRSPPITRRHWRGRILKNVEKLAVRPERFAGGVLRAG